MVSTLEAPNNAAMPIPAKELTPQERKTNMTLSSSPLAFAEGLSSALLDEEPGNRLNELLKSGFLNRHAPSLAALSGTLQDPRWHPEGDAWVHTCAVVNAISKLLNTETWQHLAPHRKRLLLGALLHDIGKPLTTKSVDGKITAHGHEQAGVQPASKILDALQIQGVDRKVILSIVENHMRPPQLYGELTRNNLEEFAYNKAVRRVALKLHAEGIDERELLLSAVADYAGRGNPLPNPIEQQLPEFARKFLQARKDYP